MFLISWLMKGTLLFALSVQATTVDRIVFVDGIKRLTLVTIRLISFAVSATLFTLIVSSDMDNYSLRLHINTRVGNIWTKQNLTKQNPTKHKLFETYLPIYYISTVLYIIILCLLLTYLFYNHCYLDNDECLKSPCDVNALCTNTPGSFRCQCKTGYSGNGFTCTGTYGLLSL